MLPYRYVAIGLVSCSMLVFEILLTRVCSLRLYFHFAFLVISNCLLGLGASGSLLALKRHVWARRPRVWIARFAGLYLLSLVVTYLVLVTYPLPTRPWATLHWESLPSVVPLFLGFNLLVALPMLFGGLVLGSLLSFNPAEVERLYAVDLMAAGVGCLLCPLALARWGAGGALVTGALLALIAVAVSAPPGRRQAATVATLLLGAAGVWLLPRLDRMLPVQGKSGVELARGVLTPNEDEEVRASWWTASARIDLVDVPAEEAVVLTRGANQTGHPPLPEEKLIFQDSTAGTFILDWSSQPESLSILDRSLYAAAVRLKHRPSVYIVGLGGGNDAWAAKLHGARSIKAVELHAPILDLHRGLLASYSRNLVEDPTVELVLGEGRSALMREPGSYDVIQLTAIDTYSALASGAYVLAENYLYTRQAIEVMYRRLEDDGILQITRLAAEAEALRLLSNTFAALASFGIDDSSDSLAVVRSGGFLAMLLKKGTFAPAESESVLRFTQEAGFRALYLPGQELGGRIEEFIRSPDREDFIARYPKNIAPTTDDRPYFFNYSRWDRPFASRASLLDAPSVSQGNALLLGLQLALSLVLSFLFILFPVARLEPLRGGRAVRYGVYFSGVGLGFIAFEIAVMQKLTLFLGHPLYSITVTLFSLLVFTGLGSLWLARRFRIDRPSPTVPAGLLALAVAFAFLSDPLVGALIGLPLGGRILIAALALLPLGLLLGIPFAYGLRILNVRGPSLIPWAWAINGCFGVVGSILTVVVSMNFGFRSVLLLASLVYGIAFWALAREVAEPVRQAAG